MNISDLLWQIRFKKRCSMKDIANEIGCSQPTIWRLVHKKNTVVNYDTAVALIAIAKKNKIEIDFTLEDIVFSGRGRKKKIKK